MSNTAYIKTNIWYMHPSINSNLQFGGGISIYSIFLFPFPFSFKQHQIQCYWPTQSDILCGPKLQSSGTLYAPHLTLGFWWSEKCGCTSMAADPDCFTAQNRSRDNFSHNLESCWKKKTNKKIKIFAFKIYSQNCTFFNVHKVTISSTTNLLYLVSHGLENA